MIFIAVLQKGEPMADIRFYIPNGETIPTDLRLYVDDVYVEYERIIGGFLFHILLDDEEKAMEVTKNNRSADD